MLPLLAPILAQLVTLNVADRTEARYISGDYTRAEGVTRPLAGLNFGWKRGAISLAYTPSFTVTPLETTPRDLLIFQGATLSGNYHWRLTSVTLAQSIGYGQLNFRVQALADPGVNLGPTPGSVPTVTPPAGAGGAPTPGGTATGGTTTSGTTTGPPAGPQATNNLPFSNRIVRYFTLTTTLGVTHQLSRQVSLGADAGYNEGRGVDASEQDYPRIRGARVGATVSHALIVGRRDTFTSTLLTQYGVSSYLSSRVWAVQANELWLHKLDPLTTTRVGAGVGGNRLSLSDGTIAYTVYPTFIAGIIHFDRLAGGIVTFGSAITATPYLDTLRATVDPRLGVVGNAAWSKRRFSMGAGAGAAVSIADNKNQGAINSVGASFGMAYLLGAGFSTDAGVSTGWQTFQGQTIVPTSWTGFVGVTFGGSVPLNGHPVQ